MHAASITSRIPGPNGAQPLGLCAAYASWRSSSASTLRQMSASGESGSPKSQLSRASESGSQPVPAHQHPRDRKAEQAREPLEPDVVVESSLTGRRSEIERILAGQQALRLTTRIAATCVSSSPIW